MQGETSSFEFDAVGVLGRTTSGGVDSAGVKGVNLGAGDGVVGETSTGQPGSAGVLGINHRTPPSSSSSPGVAGTAVNGVGVFGQGSYGVFGCGGSCVTFPNYAVKVGGLFTSLGTALRACAGDTPCLGGFSGRAGDFEGTGIGVNADGGSVGIRGRATNSDGVGVSGIANSGTAAIGVRGESTSGLAGKFEGKVHVTGTLTRAYTAGTANQATPIAYAVINSDGTVATGTPNVTSTFDSANSRYAITIAGESYTSSGYITQVMPRGFTSSLRFAEASSGSGNLLVRFKNLSNQLVQTSFYFVTYKP